MTLRTLPVAVHPGPDETFHSWLLRLAAHLELEPLATLRAVGYPLPTRAVVYPGYGITLPDRAVEDISRTTRASKERVRGTLLTTFDGGPLSVAGIDFSSSSGNRDFGRSQWVHSGTSSACIDCLTDSRYQWQLAWRLPWAAVCTKHQTVLHHRCPECGRPFNAGRRRDHGLGPGTNSVPAIDSCANSIAAKQRPFAPLCSHRYQDIPTEACEQAHILSAQTAIDELLLSGNRRRHAQLWQDLRTVTAVLLTHGNPEFITGMLPGLPEACAMAVMEHYAERDRNDAERAEVLRETGAHHTARRRRTHTQAPTEPSLVAAILPMALAVLRDLDQFPAQVGPAEPLETGAVLAALRQGVSDRNRGITSELALRQASPSLVEASKKSSGYNRLTVRHEEAVELDTRFIPRLFPWDDYEPLQETFASTRTTDDFARSYLSLCAAKLVLNSTWDDAAEALATDQAKAKGNWNAVSTRLSRAGHIDAVHQHVADWVREQAARAPETHIDYRELRQHHAQHLTVPRAEAKRILAGTGLQVTDNRRRCLAIRRWHEEAMEPLREWPGWARCSNPESAKETYRNFVKTVVPSLVSVGGLSEAR